MRIACVIDVGGTPVAVNICEDVWGEEGRLPSHNHDAREAQSSVWQATAPAAAKDAGAKVLVTADGGYYRGKVVPLKESADQAAAQGFFTVSLIVLIGQQIR